MKHIQIRVFGKVQGVWYRKTTQEMAEKLGVNGIVMNEPDGSVFIEAEADEETLDAFVAYCKKGPVHAEVGQIRISEEEPKHYKGFRIIE